MSKAFGFKPTLDRILIDLVEPEKTTESGLFIPEASIEQQPEGVIVAQGPDSSFHVGDRVVFGKYAGTVVTVDGAHYLLMRADEVFGVLT